MIDISIIINIGIIITATGIVMYVFDLLNGGPLRGATIGYIAVLLQGIGIGLILSRLL
jgi:hypothetical protein